MSDRTQDIKNLRAVATACKNYTDKKIEDLRWELGTYDLGVETVNGTTMLLPSPSGTIQATMVRIDGKSEVSENLAYIKNKSQTHSDITYVASATEQTLTLNGTSSAGSYQNFEINIIPSGTYYVSVLLSGTASTSCNLYLMDENNIGTAIGKTDAPLTNQQVTFTTNQKYLRINVASDDIVFTNLTIRIMVSKTSISEYKKGFDGIHNLDLSGLKIEGANLANITEINYRLATNGTLQSSENGNTTDYINVREGEIYSTNIASYTTSNYLSIAYYDSNKTFVSGILANQNVSNITIPSGVAYMRASYRPSLVENLMINRGSDALAYVPYIAPTNLPIDLTSIEDSGGNKLFADGKLREKNYITPTYQESVRNVVDMGTIDWGYNATYKSFYAQIEDKTTVVNSIITSLVSSIYTVTNNSTDYNTIYSDYGNMAMGGKNGNNYVYVTNDSYTSANDFKTAMSGVMLEYDRATPLVSNTNLSQLVKFEAHSNGSITLVNTNNQDTTSTFKYLKEVAK